MATNKSLKTTLNWLHERHLECIICSEKYNEPKALNCMHSFCQGCLLTYYKDATIKPCPVCGKETLLPENGVRGLKDNFYINSLLDDFLTLKIVDSSSDKKSEDGVKCENHEECIKLFCVPCKKLTCRECAVIDHPENKDHRNIDCKNAALELRKPLQDVFLKFRRDIDACTQSLQASSKAKCDFKERVAVAVSAILAQSDVVTAQVKRKEKRMINDIETLEQDRNAKFDEHEETVTKMLQEKQYTLEVAEDVVKNCSDSTFLDMYPDMTQLTSQHVPQIDRSLSSLTFKQNTTTDVDLGMLDLRTHDEKCEVKLVREGKWERCNQFEIFPVVTGIAALAKSNELALILYPHQRAVIIDDARGQIVNAIGLESGAIDIAEVQDKFAVVSTKSNLVKMYNRDGSLAFDFGTLPSYVSKDIPVKLRSVAVRKTGTVIVGDLSNKSISEHFPDGSILRFIFLKTMDPDSLTVDSNDRIVVSDHGLRQVIVIDDNGDPLITIKPTTGGQKVRCADMCCDSSGIYITVNCSDYSHIHHYNTEGKFLNCIAKGLVYPAAIKFTSDGQRLAVADCDSLKIYHKA